MIEDLAFAALRIACLSGAVMLGLRVLRIRQNQILLSVWTGVLLASLAMPALQHLMSITAYLPLGPTASLFDFAQPDAATADLIAPSAPTLMSARSSVPDWWQLASLGYVLILTVMLGRLAVGLVLSLQLLHASRPIAAPWTSGQRVRENSIIRAPATVGNSILLPSDYTAWSAETLRAVIAHEASHVANADYYILALSQLNRAIFWFNPLSWWLHRRLTSLAELAGDDAAIAALVDRSGYATILLDMAKRSCR